MRIALLFASLCVYEVSSSFLGSSNALNREDPTLKEIGKELNDAKEKVNKEFKKLQRGPGHYGDAKKPMMDDIEVMRAMMCWGRQNLIDHEQCMAWMVDNCKEETTGQGYCRKLRRYLKAQCRKGNEKGCSYAVKLGIDMKTDKEKTDADDSDGDGVKDADDAFPNNPLESKDSDGDGVGDNSDDWPNDPSRSNKKEEERKAAAPAPAAPAAKPAAAAPSPAAAPAPSGLTGLESVPLPAQGYNEHSQKLVAHDDMKTMTKDWRREWPMSHKSEDETIEDICASQPNHAWCKLKQSREHRAAYARSHP